MAKCVHLLQFFSCFEIGQEKIGWFAINDYFALLVYWSIAVLDIVGVCTLVIGDMTVGIYNITFGWSFVTLYL